MRGRGARAGRVMVAFALLLLLGLPASGGAEAHATLLSSSPDGGERLGTTPGVVVLRFSQPGDERRSRVAVTDPSGASVEGEVTGNEGRVALTTNLPGEYQVSWAVVSTDDGHTSRGSFRFTVVATAGASPGATAAGPDLAAAAARAVQYGGLLMALGMLLLGWLAGRDAELGWLRPRAWRPLVVALAGGLALVAVEALEAAPDAPLAYLTEGTPGRARLALLGAELAALAAVLVARPLLVVAGPAVVVSLAWSGHAAGTDPAWLGIALDAGHLASAGVWAGGIMALATVRPPGGWRGDAARVLLRRFTPPALTVFAIAVAFGTAQAAWHLGRVGALVDTTYGRVLVLKVIAVAGMVPLSLLAWRRHLAPRTEAGLAVVVVALTALLAVSPLPARPPAPAQAQGGDGLPRAGDLTLADPAGEVLVGLSVRPALPGPNELVVRLVPLDGEEAAARLPVALTVGESGSPALSRCGTACRHAAANLRGGENVRVVVGGDGGGEASFHLPELPTPDGGELFNRAQRRMHQLTTVAIDERLSWGAGSASARYQLQAPDRLRILTDDSETRIVGRTRYRRETSDTRWTVERFPHTPEPSYIWDYFTPPVAPRIVGSGTIGGHRTRVVAFFGDNPDVPVWFRLWVDRDGLVREGLMLAQGHFMRHRYHGFDSDDIRIAPPAR